LVPADLPGWLIPLIFFLEVVDYFLTRPMTLALRLFGNMFAGHLLLLLAITGGQYLVFDSGSAGQMFAGVFAYGGGFVMTLFELLVEFLQAYIFVLLTAMYIAGALADDH
jgi:F-type H+-transporting ATPase subunit a